MIVHVPETLQPRSSITYPPYSDVGKMIEPYFYDNRHKLKESAERIYLPIFWTNYFCNNGFTNGNHTLLLDYLNSLDKSKKYYTICQYDDGIIYQHKIDGLDILVFTCSGIGDIALPLLPSHIPLNDINLAGNKLHDFSLSYRQETHPIREPVSTIMHNHFATVNTAMPWQQYLQHIAESKFTICPRGYGKTSYRLYEAIHLGSIPVYISDEFVMPFLEIINWDTFCILIHTSQLVDMPDILHTILADTNKYEQMIKSLDEAKKYFTFDHCITYVNTIL